MPETVASLKRKITDRNYTVGVVGLGYVGLPLALRFAEVGFKVLGFDLDESKIQKLNAGGSYIQHIPGDRVKAQTGSGKFRALSDMSRLSEPDAVILCVPTPLNRYREPDLSFIEKTSDDMARALRPGQLVSLESTSYPGTTDEILLPKFTARGLKAGSDYFLVFSPEREDPGNKNFSTSTIPKLVGGYTAGCGELGLFLYSQVVEKAVAVSSTRVAEAAKVLENIYRSVNIALVNELKVVFDKMGLDVWEVIEAARTKPFGYQAFYPGPGLGGHCIPIDPFYLTWKAREYGVATRFIELAGEVNNSMPDYVVQRVGDALNARGRALKEAKVLVLGVAYKKDVDDMRESPSLEILEKLMHKGALVDYSDPYFPVIPPVRKHKLHMKSVELSPETLRGYDAVLLATDHSGFPYELIHREAALIIDSRNAFHGRGFKGNHVIKS